MKKYIYLPVIIISALFALSCGEKENKDAIRYLDGIRALYAQGEYNEALARIDSIQVLFPKAFPEIKAGLALQQDVRRASDQREIQRSDSLLAIYEPKIDSIKKMFVYRKEKDDDSGVFIPKAVNTSHIVSTALRAGVNEDGTLYIESVYTGTQLHNRIEAGTKDKQTAESLPIEDDGLNFRFSNLGSQYEVIKVTPFHDNGLAKFIVDNAGKPLTIRLKGNNTMSYSLSDVHKKAIVDSYNLSGLILLRDSLAIVKDKAQMRMKYLDSK